MRGPDPAPRLWFGGDYNPEQWPEAVVAEDMELMRRAGVNLATVGVFSWALLEPAEGRFRFDPLDRLLDRLDANGVAAALATPTASPPPWFGLAHPDALPVTADGTRLTHGSRDTYCVCAPAYTAACTRMARALAERYAGHPALAMWHVHNEYGTRCHCDHVAGEFRGWLQRRHGGLDALNDAWTTAFWSQHYTDWEQVRPPRATQYLPNPGHVLDFRRFLSDAMLANYRAQRDVLRDATPAVPVTTNFAFGSWVPVNPWQWADHLDLVAVDSYPDAIGTAGAEQTAFAADLARSWAAAPERRPRPAAGGGDPARAAAPHDRTRPSPARPWLAMEQAAGVTYTGTRTVPKAPGETLRHAVGHVARGSHGAMFFQWRESRGGAEQWHSGMVPHAGPDSAVHREIRDLGALLPRLAGARDTAVVADAAIVWDPECWWALESRSLPARGLDYRDLVAQAHRALWRSGRTVDFVEPGAAPPAVPLLVVPALYLTSDATAAALARYADAGGTLVVTFLSGIADPNGTVITGGYPGALRELLGVRVERFHPLEADETVAVAWTGPEAGGGPGAPGGPGRFGEPGSGIGPGADAGCGGGDGGDKGAAMSGRQWSELVHPGTADVVARYVSGSLAGRPAITRRAVGQGGAWYVSTRLAGTDLEDLLTRAAPPPAGPPAPPSPGVEIVRRVRGDDTWVFVLNHTDREHAVDAHLLGAGPGATDLVSGRPADGLSLAPGGVAVLHGARA
ncbi:beta-galactosidase [Nocardiopsis mangrovi]|uniref:beta-galactosidase n=1 Tax=Nocardiopsis mangrovi TaxID=1179818 RepID=A0ABV9E3L0_9ACTN